MFCIKCGTQNEDGARFCTACGASLTDVVWSAPKADPAPQPEPESNPEPDQDPAPAPETAPASEAPADAPEPGLSPSEGAEPPVEEPPVEAPPQEWPDYAEQGPILEGGSNKKSLGTGAILGIIVGVLAVVSLIIVGVFSATGTLPSEGDAPVESLEEKLDELLGDGVGSADSAELAGTIFDLTCYETTPRDIGDFLEGSDFALIGSWASEGGSYSEPYMSVTFAGDYDGPAPIPIDGTYVEVTVQVELGSTQIVWDEDGYADDAISSLGELADDAVVTGVQIDFYTSVGPDSFASAAHGAFSSMGLSRASGVSASNERILDSALAEFGLSASAGDVSDYIGDVLFVTGDPLEFAGREAYCQVSLMGGEEFGGDTMAGISVFS